MEEEPAIEINLTCPRPIYDLMKNTRFRYHAGRHALSILHDELTRLEEDHKRSGRSMPPKQNSLL